MAKTDLTADFVDPNTDDLPGRVAALQAVVAEQAEALRSLAADVAVLVDRAPVAADVDADLSRRVRYIISKYFAAENDLPPVDFV